MSLNWMRKRKKSLKNCCENVWKDGVFAEKLVDCDFGYDGLICLKTVLKS